MACRCAEMDGKRVHTQAEGVLRTVKVLSSACQVMYYSDTSKETPVRNGRGFSFQQEGLSVVSVCRKFNSHANSLKGLHQGIHIGGLPAQTEKLDN